jgi:hypothetical protein
MRIIFISDLLSDGCNAVDPDSEDGEFLAQARCVPRVTTAFASLLQWHV